MVWKNIGSENWGTVEIVTRATGRYGRPGLTRDCIFTVEADEYPDINRIMDNIYRVVIDSANFYGIDTEDWGDNWGENNDSRIMRLAKKELPSILRYPKVKIGCKEDKTKPAFMSFPIREPSGDEPGTDFTTVGVNADNHPCMRNLKDIKDESGCSLYEILKAVSRCRFKATVYWKVNNIIRKKYKTSVQIIPEKIVILSKVENLPPHVSVDDSHNGSDSDDSDGDVLVYPCDHQLGPNDQPYYHEQPEYYEQSDYDDQSDSDQSDYDDRE